MTGHERRAEKKKESIRQASIELFTTMGIRKVTMNEIADRANVSKVSIYNYFRSKDELILDIMKTVCDQILENVKEIVESSLSFQDKLKKVITYKSRGSGIFKGEFLQQLLSHDQAAQEYYEREFKPKSRLIMHRFFQEGKQTGHIAQDIPIETIELYVQIFQNGMERSPLVMRTEQIPEELIRLFFYGLMQR
ncbi:TetR/AcrR family transcriptional regulator [Marispirochaeta sp.]|jgi:AcrR family transcriptional regulator|uniref:TetR/AcrR family transcriptional regulator n=1 Tax=Marispirochaeta sp. TaxID=2038653 RepID=UPI0029C6CD09|nr:TetR/AcrR family transcriptional regulator [Marispirochaeta sp.]